MGPDLTSFPRTTACPSCGGALRPEATWCSLCFYDFRAAANPAPAPEPVLEQYAVPPPPAPAPDPLTGPLLDVALPQAVPTQAAVPQQEAVPQGEPAAAGPAWPCARCGFRNGFETTACGACGAGFLEGASEAPSLVVPGVGDVFSRKRSSGGSLGDLPRGRLVSLAVVAVLMLVVPLVVLRALVGQAATRADQQQSPTTTPNTPYVTVVPPQQQVPGP